MKYLEWWRKRKMIVLIVSGLLLCLFDNQMYGSLRWFHGRFIFVVVAPPFWFDCEVVWIAHVDLDHGVVSVGVGSVAHAEQLAKEPRAILHWADGSAGCINTLTICNLSSCPNSLSNTIHNPAALNQLNSFNPFGKFPHIFRLSRLLRLCLHLRIHYYL